MTSHKDSGEVGDGMLDFPPYLDIRPKEDGRVVSSKLRPHFILSVISIRG